MDCVVAAGLEPAKPKHPGYSRAPLPLGYATENRVRVSHCKPNIVRLSIMCHHPVGALLAGNQKIKHPNAPGPWRAEAPPRPHGMM